MQPLSNDPFELDAMIALRRDLHAHPELGFEEVRTSEIVARMLAEAGIEVHRGLGKTGVVGRLRVGDGACNVAGQDADGQQKLASIGELCWVAIGETGGGRGVGARWGDILPELVGKKRQRIRFSLLKQRRCPTLETNVFKTLARDATPQQRPI